MWPTGFSYGGDIPPSITRHPSSPLPFLQSGCTCEEKEGTGSSYSAPSPRGVCCSILMTKRGAGARSRYHTLICLKRASLTIQSAGVHRNPVKAGGVGCGGGDGCINDKRQKQPHFFVHEARGSAQFQSAVLLSPKNPKDGFMHFNGGIPA